MADKLVYKGGTKVVGHTGTEIELVRPTRGTLHRFPRWWNRKGSVAYIDAAIFRVTFENGAVVRLVVPTSLGAHSLEIRHDGFGNFVFPVNTGVDRVAVISNYDNTLYREYQFSKISGGAMLTRTILPYPAPAKPVSEEDKSPSLNKKTKSKTKTKTTVKVTVAPSKEQSND